MTAVWRRGYTLVESMMVIMIMALLMIILTPQVNRYRDEAAANTTRANLENLRAAIQMFYDDQGSWPADLLLNDKLADDATWPFKTYIEKIPGDGFNNNDYIFAANSMDNSGGWIYEPLDGTILPNLMGQDPYGVNYSDY